MRKLLALLAILAGPALAQQPNGTINAPIYATGYISQVGGTIVTTKIAAQPNHPTNLNIYTTGDISGTWNIQLPNPAFEGQILSFSCGGSAAAISITSSDGSTVDSNLPTACVGASTFAAQFDQRNNIWRYVGYGNTAGIIPSQLPAFTGGDCITSAGSVVLNCNFLNASNLVRGTLTTSRLPLAPIYVSAYALANGSDQSTNLATAFALCSTYGKIIVDDGYTYSTGLTIPDGCSIEFQGQTAKLIYTGAGDALTISRSKNITIRNLNLDMSGAGTSAIGIHAKGMWFTNIYDPVFLMKSSASSQIAIWIETSVGGGDDFGSYVNRIQGINANGVGTYAIGIKTSRTSGDINHVTALTISGGWIANAGTSLSMDQTSTFRIEGTALSNGTNAVDVGNSSDGFVSTGEIGAMSGYCYVWRSGNSNINLQTPTSSSYSCATVQNNSIYTPQQLSQGYLQLFGSPTDQTYWASIASLPSYTKAFALTVAGTGSGQELMSWGYGQGYLGVGQSAGGVDELFGRTGSITSQASGFNYFPSVAGTPTGTPTTYSGYSPILFDTTGNRLWYYNSGWRQISFTPITGITIASLPACAAGNLGTNAIISNGTAYGTGTYGSAVSATGIVTRNVLCTNTAGATTYAWVYN